MGARGPIPKRLDQSRHHRTKAEAAAVQQVAVGAVVVAMPEPDPLWHAMAADWFRSLGESGQAQWYQPSDWQTARVWAEVLSRQLAGGRLSSQMIAAWASSATELLTTEGSRRRARLELSRPIVDGDEEAAVADLDDYRSRVV